MSQPVPSSAGEFRLDVDLANAAITKLEEVRGRLELIRDDASTLAVSTPETAHDAVSREAFALLRSKADGGPGSLVAALEAGIDHVQGLINRVEIDLAEQRQLDESAGQRLRRS